MVGHSRRAISKLVFARQMESVTAGQVQKFCGVVETGASNFSTAMGWR